MSLVFRRYGLRITRFFIDVHVPPSPRLSPRIDPGLGDLLGDDSAPVMDASENADRTTDMSLSILPVRGPDEAFGCERIFLPAYPPDVFRGSLAVVRLKRSLSFRCGHERALLGTPQSRLHTAQIEFRDTTGQCRIAARFWLGHEAPRKMARRVRWRYRHKRRSRTTALHVIWNVSTSMRLANIMRYPQ
jgi:hypothetical protein